MKKFQQLFDTLNQKLEGDLSGIEPKSTGELPAKEPAPSAPDKLDSMFELPIASIGASVGQAAAKGVGSIKSLISPLADKISVSKLSAKVADVLHPSKADEEFARQAPQLDPLLSPAPTRAEPPKVTKSQPDEGMVFIRSEGYQATRHSEYELAENTLANDGVKVAAFDAKPSIPAAQTLPPKAEPIELVSAPLESKPLNASATAQHRAPTAAEVMPVLSAEQVKTPSQPVAAPRKSKRELPVLDMSHIQRNLERSQRKLTIEGAKMPERKTPEPLPVIDPSEVRERLQDIHSGKRPSAKIKPAPSVRAPIQRCEHNAAAGVERLSRAAPVNPSPVQRAPEPEVIRVFKSSQAASVFSPVEPAAQVLPTVPVVPTVQSESIQSESMNLLPQATRPEALAAVELENDFYPAASAPAELNVSATPAMLPQNEDVPMGYKAADFLNHNLQQNTAQGIAPIEAVSPSRPTEFLRPDAIAPAVKPASDAAWRGEDGLCLPLELLRPATAQAITVTQEDLLERSILIEEKLNEFKVKVSVLDAYAGPVITRFEVEPATGIRGAQVVNLAKDLARSLGLASVRVVETIPGKTCMGLELPNPTRQMIRLSEILSAPEYHQQVSPLTIALGKDISGIPVATDLAKTPHMLVAGTTGSGKSVGVNAMILSILFKATPEEVRFIMIDPKMLELSVYEGIPHLLAPVVTDMKLAANALNWCVGEMEKRYRLMSALGVRNLAGYNQKIAEAKQLGKKLTNPFTLTPDDPEPLEHLPMIVVVVDEFADLMMVAGKKIEELIARLAQKARAAGIHLILATQRPSVDVITGLIKANIPTRLAFQVSSKVDSRTILDQMGAEALLGQGDMLFLPPGTGYPQRIHGAFVDDAEVHCVVEYLKQMGEPDYIEGVLYPSSEAESGGSWSGVPGDAEESDPLYDEAVAHVIRSRRASISAVQRQFRIGYNRAARLIEQMESAGIVSSMESNGNRTVLAPHHE